jgi:regulator of protease activity HflC (stomatin/prohibitin superfamily)
VQAQITVTQANAKANAVRAEAQANADATRLNGEARASNIKITGEAEAAAIEARARALGTNPNLVKPRKAEADETEEGADRAFKVISKAPKKSD